MNIYCQLGLGNRLSTIAASLKQYGVIDYYWRRNRDLPNDHSVIFPNGIPNVTFHDLKSGCPSTGLRGMMAYDYFDDVDYVSSMDWLAGNAHCKPSVALHGRFHRLSQANALDLVEAIPEGTESVFVLCDQHRAVIYQELTNRKIKIIEAKSREMTSDFDRLESDILPFISDWKSLCLASTIITNCPQSSALYPSRQKGAEIISVKI
jgi:hypothetical protein